MGRLILVTGGARSGKSTFAEKLAGDIGDKILYVATSIPFDEEMRLRINLHRERRPVGWETVEGYRDLDTLLINKINGKSAVLIDCITVMITNIMWDIYPDLDNIKVSEVSDIESKVKTEIKKLITFSGLVEIPVIIVTNEVGMGIVPENALSRLFRDIAGRMNQILAQAAQEVYLCVSGIPVKIK